MDVETSDEAHGCSKKAADVHYLHHVVGRRRTLVVLKYQTHAVRPERETFGNLNPEATEIRDGVGLARIAFYRGS